MPTNYSWPSSCAHPLPPRRPSSEPSFYEPSRETSRKKGRERKDRQLEDREKDRKKKKKNRAWRVTFAPFARSLVRSSARREAATSDDNSSFSFARLINHVATREGTETFRSRNVRQETCTIPWENGRTCQSRDPTPPSSLSLFFFSLKLKNRVRLEAYRVRRAWRDTRVGEEFLSFSLSPSSRQAVRCTRGKLYKGLKIHGDGRRSSRETTLDSETA